MAAKVSAGAIAKIWKDRRLKYGALKEATHQGTNYATIFSCALQRPSAVKVVVDDRSTIVGIFLAPAQKEKRLDISGASGQTRTALKVASTFVQHFSSGRFSEATTDFSQSLKRSIPPAVLSRIWTRVSSGQKPPTSCALSSVSVQDETLLRYDRADFLSKTYQDVSGTVVGWFYSGQHRDPVYADPASYAEKDVVIGKAPWALPGTLTFPKQGKPAAAFVLVHGSGPNDRDESVAAHKPFRDLALGLASRGFAVLRYDKRTRVHGSKMKGWPTLDEETTDDAIAAADYLEKRVGITRSRIIVVGHSRGGQLVPRIARKDKSLGGFVVLAGSTLPLEDVINYQVRYIAAADGKVTPREQERIERTKMQAARVRAGKYTQKTPTPELLGIAASRWKEFRAYRTLKVAKRIRRPTLVLQGECDYQVTMQDYAGWKKALGKKKWATFKTFAALGHTFVACEGEKGVPADYDKPGNVAVEVIDTIDKWAKVLIQ